MGVTGCSGWTARAGGRFVFEGQALMRRKGWVYLFYSGSVWSSTNYAVSWIAAPSVRELADGSVTRLEGQYVVPYDVGLVRHTFGHGRPVLGQDGETWFYSFHHLTPKSGIGPRRAFLAPIQFVDLRDGRGDVWIQPILPPVNSALNTRRRRSRGSRRRLAAEDAGAAAASGGGCAGGGPEAQAEAEAEAELPAPAYTWAVRSGAADAAGGGAAVAVASDGGPTAELRGARSGDEVVVTVTRREGGRDAPEDAQPQARGGKGRPLPFPPLRPASTGSDSCRRLRILFLCSFAFVYPAGGDLPLRDVMRKYFPSRPN